MKVVVMAVEGEVEVEAEVEAEGVVVGAHPQRPVLELNRAVWRQSHLPE